MKLSCLDPKATCKGTIAHWVVIYPHYGQGTLEKRNLLLGAAAVICAEGYREHSFCVPRRREAGVEGEGEGRRTMLMLGQGVVLTSRWIGETPWRSWSLEGAGVVEGLGSDIDFYSSVH